MIIAGEWYVCVNMLMNVACLAAASRLCTRRVRAGRIALAAAAGTALSMAALSCWGLRASVYAALPLAVLMAMLAFGPRGVPAGSVQLFIFALMAAGLAQQLHRMGLTGLAAALACVPAVGYAGVLLTRWRSRAGERAEVRLLFESGGVTLDGMVDSGNLLRDPVTSLPVVVAPYEALRRHLPEGMECENLDTLPRGFRLICVCTAGGMKLLMCFRPRALYIRNGCVWHAARAVVAVSPALRGRRALLPPTLNS